jgi:pimeloyl-ACP methyl ester carboxylesterase
MATFVLVHGAWHGAWCWSQLVSVLETGGHRVVTLDLPGHGDDPTPPADVTLEDYVDRVVGVLVEEPDPVVLVGHSMGGMVISGAAEQAPDRIACLVYLTAFLPEPGHSLLAMEERNPGSAVPPALVPSEDGRTFTLQPDRIRALFYHDCSDADFDRAMGHLTPQAAAPLAEPLVLTKERFGSVRRAYVECTEDKAICIEMQRLMIDASGCDEVVSMAASHSPFFSAPAILADHLVAIAARSGLTSGSVAAPA